MKNKRTLLFAGILAAFLMLAVPFAVVSFDAEDADAIGEGKIKIDDAEYETIQDAIDSLADNETAIIELVGGNVSGNGFIIPQDKNLNLTFNLNGYTYTFDGMPVASGSVKTIGAQILKGNTITFTNGVFDVISSNASKESGNRFCFLIQNYSVLTLDDVTLDGMNLTKGNFPTGEKYSVVVSGNKDVTIVGETNIIANNTGYAVDACDYEDYGGAHIIFGTNDNPFTGTVTGMISYTRDSTSTTLEESLDNTSIQINGGTFNITGYTKKGFDNSAPSNIEITAGTLNMSTGSEGILNDASKGVAGNVIFVGDFETTTLIMIKANGNLIVSGIEGNSLAGLIVDGNDKDVTISGLMTESVGIAVFDADVVKIQNCNVCSVNEELYQYSHNIFGIRVSESNNVTISGNVISDIETIAVGGIKYDGVGIGIYKINESVAINEGNVVSDTGHNSIWIVDSKNASVTIEDNEIFNWAINGEGRAIRIQNVNSTVISDNLFSKDTVSENLESTVKVDCNPSEEISVTFNGDILSGNAIFIDDGTTYDSLSVDAESTYYCYDTTIRGSLSAEGDSAFHIAKGGMLSLLSGATINCTINGPGGARITLSNITAGETGIIIVGGSITLHGSIVGGAGSSVVVDSDDITLDGEFLGAVVTVNAGYTVGIGDGLVFGSGTKVVLESGAEFSEDPVFDKNSEVTIDGKKTIITEKSKVSSSGVIRTGFILNVICENGTVYYNAHSGSIITVEVYKGDTYRQYFDKLFVDADPGYSWSNVFTNGFGIPVSDYSVINEGDELFATCYAVKAPSESEIQESAGFDIADHVVLIEAVIAVLVLIGFVAYIRKN